MRPGWSEQWTLGSNSAVGPGDAAVVSGPTIYDEQTVEVIPKLEAEQRVETAEATGKRRLLDEHEARVAAEQERDTALADRLHVFLKAEEERAKLAGLVDEAGKALTDFDGHGDYEAPVAALRGLVSVISQATEASEGEGS